MVLRLVYLVMLLVSAAALLRLVLILTGTLKGPLLALFESYGDAESRFFPLPSLIFWFGLLVAAGASVLFGPALRPRSFEVFAGLSLLVAVGILYFRNIVLRVFWWVPRSPAWFERLKHVTERVERRRIAYMWLRLPRRTRLLYSANDRLFFQWAELVIIATTNDA